MNEIETFPNLIIFGGRLLSVILNRTSILRTVPSLNFYTHVFHFSFFVGRRLSACLRPRRRGRIRREEVTGVRGFWITRLRQEAGVSQRLKLRDPYH